MRAGRLRRLPRVLMLRGRRFSSAELGKIRAITLSFGKFGRTRISVEVCKALSWTQPNGWLKDRACRDVLRSLERQRFLRLPKPKRTPADRPSMRCRSQVLEVAPKPRTLHALPGPIAFKLAKGDDGEQLWNELVNRHHYLGHKVIVGKCLKFLIYSGGAILGAVSLSESAWAVADRDEAIASLRVERHQVANNTRFLVLPHVKVKSLGSRILGLFARAAVQEWRRYYSIRLKCLETFVDTIRFKGTSYKAANWVCVGTTRGFRKSGAAHLNSQTPKFVFLYPLGAKDRERLRCQMARTDGKPR